MPIAATDPHELSLRPWEAHTRDWSGVAPAARPAPSVTVTPALMRWASGIAVAVAKGHRFTGHEREELRAVAYFELVRYANAWNAESANLTTGDAADVTGAFRGYCSRPIRWECLRAARQLRSGGTVRPNACEVDPVTGKRRPPVVFADPLSCLSTPAGDPFDVPDRERDDGAD